jgi:dTDP-4-dehydrorhamnose 3,5-epimerase
MSSRAFRLSETSLPGVMLLERGRIEDARGFLSRLFCSEELVAAGFDTPIAQVNHTLTRRRGAMRGLHFQHPPHAEIKVVTVLEGEVFDVAVDLRRGSPTFLRWHAEVLSAANNRSLLIPRGFAHGFQTLTENCQLIYFHSAAYAPRAEAGLSGVDPALGIRWPLDCTDVSPRDLAHPMIDSSFKGIET